jgi:hypothetical protein
MELRDALNKADRILNQERRSPTVAYLPVVNTQNDPNPAAQIVAEIMQDRHETRLLENLDRERLKRPRQVLEGTRVYHFKSVNHELLCALMAQLEEAEKPFFVSGLVCRIPVATACDVSKDGKYPSWNGLVSELPLIAEFAVRNHGKEGLLQTIGEANPLLSHVFLLRHLEEMISLNFMVFTDADYEHLVLSIRNFARTAEDRLQKCYEGDIHLPGWPPLPLPAIVDVFGELRSSADAIEEQCREAQYLYLKGDLLEGLNLEVNQDKDVVQSYLSRFGFSKTLIEALDVVEQLYRAPGTTFDSKSCIGHLRSFLETLQKEAMPGLVAKYGGNAPSKWGEGLVYLRDKNFLTKAEENFTSGLYVLMSDEAVHPLIAEREYARLARNMVIEYGLLFLRKLEKLGVRIK